MGIDNVFYRNCYTNGLAIAPNPSPERWNLIEKVELKNSHVLKVKYLDATNFEGIKIMVFKGKYHERYLLDPHFTESIDSPIARFKPDDEGWELALNLAKSLSSI